MKNRHSDEHVEKNLKSKHNSRQYEDVTIGRHVESTRKTGCGKQTTRILVQERSQPRHGEGRGKDSPSHRRRSKRYHEMTMPDVPWRPVSVWETSILVLPSMPLHESRQHLRALRSLTFYAVESENPKLRHYATSEKWKSKPQFWLDLQKDACATLRTQPRQRSNQALRQSAEQRRRLEQRRHRLDSGQENFEDSKDLTRAATTSCWARRHKFPADRVAGRTVERPFEYAATNSGSPIRTVAWLEIQILIYR